MAKEQYIFRTQNLVCNSCEGLIRRAIAKACGGNANLEGVDFTRQELSITCEPQQVSQLAREISQAGYPVRETINAIVQAVKTQGATSQIPNKTEPTETSHAKAPATGQPAKDRDGELDDIGRVWAVAGGLLKGNPEFAAERELVEMALLSFGLIALTAWMLFVIAFDSSPKLLGKLGFFVALDALASVASVSTIYHFKLFRREWSCMSGMMIGMTIGMGTGFLFGALIGATNGMFVGSLVGMAIGMPVGAWAGRCCGIMGVMEGLMAGLMSGTMGAMLSVMMLNDHLHEFLAILWVTSIGILSALSFMMYKEAGSLKKEHFDVSFFEFFMASLIPFLVIFAIMVFGPRSGVL